jgi:hypothetical protein
MGLQDVYDGRQSWAEFISGRAQIEGGTESGPEGQSMISPERKSVSS